MKAKKIIEDLLHSIHRSRPVKREFGKAYNKAIHQAEEWLASPSSAVVGAKELRDKFFNDLVRKDRVNLPEFNRMPHNVFEWIKENVLSSNATKLPSITEEINKILGMDQPWPLVDVLRKLVEATHILLHDKDYDGHGWEEIEICHKRGNEIIELLSQIKESGLKEREGLDLDELERKLDEVLDKETSESLKAWLNEKRTSSPNTNNR